MKRPYLLFIALFISLCVSCTSNKGTSKSNEVSSVKTEEISGDSTVRFIVSFYSIGSGIEGLQMERFKKFITEYGHHKTNGIYYSSIAWGREGEVDFCIPLNELSAEEQKDFIASAKNLMKSGKWIQYFENQPCRKQN